MKIYYLALYSMALCGQIAIGMAFNCDFAVQRITHIKEQTEKAIQADNINTARYFAYKALNAIEKSKKQWQSCDCEYAVSGIQESLIYLKQATKAFSLGGTRIQLKRVMDHVLISETAIAEHGNHDESKYADDVLEMNTKEITSKDPVASKSPQGKQLERRIEASLVNFENSLAKVVASVDCQNALEFANKLYENCEKELLREDLTEAKKYFNLKTKEIVAEALVTLNGCPN